MQALLQANITILGDVDHLDPGVKGDASLKGFKGKGEREAAIQKQLDEMRVPGPSNVHKALIKAIIDRNECTLQLFRHGSSGLPMNDMEVSAS